MEKAIIVRYGEIGLKTYWVRREFEKRLVDNISRMLLENGVNLEKIKQRGARTYIWCNPLSKALKLLKNVFGIVSYSPSYVMATDLDKMKKMAVKLYKKSGAKTFRISTRRVSKEFPLTSMEISAQIGKYVIEKTGAKVKLKNYDLNICFELNKKQTFAFSEFYKGWGGLPIGAQGKVLCVLSDKKESWLNAWAMARRGCEVALVGIDKSTRAFAKKFEKKYYYFEDELAYYDMKKFSIEKIIDIAKRENAKAIVLENKFIGKFEGKTNLLIFYPSLGYSSKKIRDIMAQVEM